MGRAGVSAGKNPEQLRCRAGDADRRVPDLDPPSERLKVVTAAASISRPHARHSGQAQLGWFETTEDRDIRRNFDVNVFGTMNVARAVPPHMRAKRTGLLVTSTSVSGLVANQGGSIYSATKVAVEGWIEGLSQA